MVQFRVKSRKSKQGFSRVFALLRNENHYEVKVELFRVDRIKKAKKKARLSESHHTLESSVNSIEELQSFHTDTQNSEEEDDGSKESEDEDLQIFERYVEITSKEVVLVAESSRDFSVDILAEFQAEKFDRSYFSGIQKTWLNYTNKELHEEKSYITPQRFIDSHDGKLKVKIKECFSSESLKRKLEHLKKTIKRNVTPKLIIQRIMEAEFGLLKQIFLIYKWVTECIQFEARTSLIVREEIDFDRSPAKVCQTHKSDAKGISGLFWACIQELRAVKPSVKDLLDCILVDGFAKQEDCLDYEKTNHTWNLLKYKDYWYIVDCSKGSLSAIATAQSERVAAPMMGSLNNLGSVVEFTAEEKHDLNRYYFFTAPNEFSVTHFCEEDCYSLLYSYSFSMEQFLEAPIFHPLMKINQINLLTKIKYNDTLRGFFEIKLESEIFSHIFVIKQEQILSNNMILQKCRLDEETGKFLYNVYIIDFDDFGNKSIKLCLEKISDRRRRNSTIGLQKRNSGFIRSFFEASANYNKRKRDLYKTLRPLLEFNLMIDHGEDLNLKEKEAFLIKPKLLVEASDMIQDITPKKSATNNSIPARASNRAMTSVVQNNFTAFSKFKTPQNRRKEGIADSVRDIKVDKDISTTKPKLVNLTLDAPMMDINQATSLQNSRQEINNSIAQIPLSSAGLIQDGEFKSFNHDRRFETNRFSHQSRSPTLRGEYQTCLKVLSPGVYYIPVKVDVEFLIYWRHRDKIMMIGNGRVQSQKVGEDLYKFTGCFEEGFVHLKSDSGALLMEFNAVDYSRIPSFLSNLIDLKV